MFVFVGLVVVNFVVVILVIGFPSCVVFAVDCLTVVNRAVVVSSLWVVVLVVDLIEVILGVNFRVALL